MDLPRKLFNEEVNIIINKFSLKFYKNNEYKNSKVKITFIDNEGFLYYTNIDSLVSGYSPLKFSKHNPHTIYNIKNYININNITTKLKSKEYAGNDNKLSWRCECGNEYECSLHHFLGVNQFYCKECSLKNSIELRKLNKDYVISELIKNNYTPIFNKYDNTNNGLLCLDKDGYKVLVDFQRMQRGASVAPIHISNPYTIQNIKYYVEKNKIKCELLSNKYNGSGGILEFKCHCGNHFKTSWDSFYNNNIYECQQCAIQRRAESHRLEINEVKQRFIDNGYIPLFNLYENNSEKLLCKNSEGYMGEINLNNISSGMNFGAFSTSNNYFSYNINHFIEINNINCDLINVDKNKITFKCKCGNYFTTTFASFKRGKRQCDECSNVKSKYEIKVEDWLNVNNIKFNNQYKYNDCKNIYSLPFDFYLPNYNILIEVNGIQHYKSIKYWGGEKGFAEQQKRDKIKYNYCKLNNIHIIILPYFEFKKNNGYIKILTKDLLGDRCLV